MNNFLVQSKKGLLCGLILALLVAACTEREESGLTRVRGQVVLADSNTPVPTPPPVQVWAQATGGMIGSAYAPVGAPHATDEQGKFDFSFPAEGGQQYVLRAAEGRLGYYTDWNLARALRKGEENEVRLPVYAPAWIRLDLVDEPPRSRVWMFFSGFGGGGLTVPYPRDTTLIFPYLTGPGKESFIFWAIKDTLGRETEYRRTFIQPPLDTQRVRIAF
ncbi:hypothetical protein Q5H93_11975 [Hymenobacter sp. ASUV-10]|uniref:Carboxypeptidase regulatory-like domain-containing protein n=1 Tax=Hymenobacter aranciens TaxID=3063996 RepID=A0ABT9BB12_9BACT|nr:hypothetical protein [Hymenobacter sp. ASUV-10]MDO7875451.1 hypothetical protein [Hymenobacter sp. ASUV-10]